MDIMDIGCDLLEQKRELELESLKDILDGQK